MLKLEYRRINNATIPITSNFHFKTVLNSKPIYELSHYHSAPLEQRNALVF